MENFYRENIDKLLEICQIRQYFPPSKICTVRYLESVQLDHELKIMENYLLKPLCLLAAMQSQVISKFQPSIGNRDLNFVAILT